MNNRNLITEEEKKRILNMHESFGDLGFIDNIKSMFGSLVGGAKETGSSIAKSIENLTNKLDLDGAYVPKLSGSKVDISKGNFTNKQKQNIDLLIHEMEKQGITDPLTQIGVLSVIDKESGFIPQNETSYGETSNERIRKIFGKRVEKYNDSELTQLKKSPKRFFNVVYSKVAGNKGGDDGSRYVGRGFNGLTGKGNYEKYGRLTNTEIFENPEMLNDPEVAAKVAIKFFTKGKSASSFPKFSSPKEAAIYFADINAGGHSSFGREKAISSAKKFSLK